MIDGLSIFTIIAPHFKIETNFCWKTLFFGETHILNRLYVQVFCKASN